MSHPSHLQPWRVCMTRDEVEGGPLAAALRRHQFEPVACPVLVEGPPENAQRLNTAARNLERYDWVVCASARSVRALTRARGSQWPDGVRTAAVGAATARALSEAGVAPPPVTADGDGADSLWARLHGITSWKDLHVLLPTTSGGGSLLRDRLRDAGAIVEFVEVYTMQPRRAADIARDWAAASPDAAVIASSRAAEALVDAVGVPALNALRHVVAIGRTTSDTLARHGVACVVPERADFDGVARALASCRDVEMAT